MTESDIPSTISLRILVVDDNRDTAQTLAWALEVFGHEVHAETNGPKALEAARDLLPEIVLLDIGLPDMNGYEICKAMKNIEGLEDTVFIAQTGWDKEKYRQLSKEAGFFHHFIKPVNIDELQQTILSAVKILN